MHVLCAQLTYRARDLAPGLDRITANAGHLDELLRRQADPLLDLVSLGEFWLASPTGPDEYASSAVLLPGPVDGVLGDLARDHEILLSANLLERDEAGELYDTTVLVGPTGQVLLRYREVAGGLISGSAIAGPVGGARPRLGVTGAGLAGWLPVVDTDFGRLAALVGSDLTYPELSIALTRAGVDVLLHAAKEPPATEGPYQAMKTARAVEGGYAIVSSNIADGSADSGPWAASRGRSRVIDARGATVAESDTDGEDLLVADLDTRASREIRTQPRWERRRSSAWADHCAAMFGAPAQGAER